MLRGVVLVLTPASSSAGLPSSAVTATATMSSQYQYQHNEGGDCLLLNRDTAASVQYSTVQYSTVQYQYRHNEGGDCLLSTEILQHQASPGLGSWEGGQLLCHSTWPTNKYIRYLDTYNMYNMTPSSKVPLDQSRLHTAMLTSCPYYNVKLSKVVLELPLLTYSDHKVAFTNPKLTNKVT